MTLTLELDQEITKRVVAAIHTALSDINEIRPWTFKIQIPCKPNFWLMGFDSREMEKHVFVVFCWSFFLALFVVNATKNQKCCRPKTPASHLGA